MVESIDELAKEAQKLEDLKPKEYKTSAIAQIYQRATDYECDSCDCHSCVSCDCNVCDCYG